MGLCNWFLKLLVYSVTVISYVAVCRFRFSAPTIFESSVTLENTSVLAGRAGSLRSRSEEFSQDMKVRSRKRGRQKVFLQRCCETFRVNFTVPHFPHIPSPFHRLFKKSLALLIGCPGLPIYLDGLAAFRVVSLQLLPTRPRYKAQLDKDRWKDHIPEVPSLHKDPGRGNSQCSERWEIRGLDHRLKKDGYRSELVFSAEHYYGNRHYLLSEPITSVPSTFESLVRGV